MKKKALIITAVLAVLSIPCSAQFWPKSKKARENALLKSQVDSLKRELEITREQLSREDSLRNEIFALLENHNHSPQIQKEEIIHTPEMADSLLGEWYRQLSMMNAELDEKIDMDSVHFSSEVPDSVLVARLKAINCIFPLPYNETVRNYMILYTEKAPKRLAKLIGMSQYYFPIFEEVLQQYGLPQELKYMTVIESAFNPKATSRAGAKGLWQFMYRTGKQYGLEISTFVDERMDTYKVTDAAARLLRDSYRIFGDWCLAISSYNCGPGGINKAINRAGGKMDYWDVYDFLPRETRRYVPAFVGALYAFSYYKEYNIIPEQPALPVHTDTIVVRRNLHFKQISETVGISEEILANLNSQYVHDIIPGNSRPCSLILPVAYTASFISRENDIYAFKAEELVGPKVIETIEKTGVSSRGSSSGGRIVYKVRQGDTLGKIAARYHVSVKQIQRLNGLKGTMIRVGQNLVVRN